MMHHTQRWQRWDWLAAGALAALACVFWGNCLWGGKVPVAAVYHEQMLPWSAVSEAGGETRQWDSLLWDSMAQFYPWRLLLHKAGQQGELPLWNPYQFCGYPFVGNGQSAMFYPPNWLYFIIHPKIGMGLSAALHYFLGSLFVFGLAHRWRLGTIPAVFSAIAFTYGGFVITWIELPTLVNSLIWLPLAWWGIEELIAWGKLPTCPAHGRASYRPAARGLLMLATALGMTLLAGHFQIAAYVWIFTALYGVARLTAIVNRRDARTTRRVLITSGVAVGLAGLLAMAQLLPTLELGRYSARGAGRPSADGFRFHQERALQPIELLSLLQADFLGTPVDGSYQGISYSEHCPFVGASTIALGLVGLAVGWRRRHVWLFFGIALFALWGAMGGPPAMLLYWCVPKLGQAGGFSRLLSVWTLAASLWGGAGLQVVLDRAASSVSFVGRELVPRPSSANTALAAFALLLLAVEMLPWAYRFNPRADAASVYPETEAIARLREMAGEGRYVALNDRRDWGLAAVPAGVVMPPNAGTVYGLRCVDGYDSLFPLAYRQLAAKIEDADPSPLANGNMLLLSREGAWGSPLACVEVVRLRENDPVRGNAWVGDGLRLTSTGPQVRSWVQVTRAGQTAESSLSRLLYTALGQSFDGLNQVRLAVPPERVTSSGNASMVLSQTDSWYPGWRCYVDGRERPIVPHLFQRPEPTPARREVSFNPGDRIADFVYTPASVACGLFVSLLALMILVALGTLKWGGRAQ